MEVEKLSKAMTDIHAQVAEKATPDRKAAIQKHNDKTHVCYALQRMRPLTISWAECSVVISCGKVDYDKFCYRGD
jgi:hypothetical protein